VAADAAALTELARLAGTHAVPGFVVLLALLLLAVGVIDRSVRRYALPRIDGRWPPGAFLALYFAIGVAVLIGAASLFAELADALEADEPLGDLDEAFTAALRQSVSPATLRVFAWVTHFGDVETLTVLCAVVALLLLARGHRGLALVWIVAVAGNGVLNRALKALFRRVRPVHDEPLVLADGYSFPSGHSSGAVVAYGMLVYLSMRLLPAPWHLPAVLLATTIAFATGASRVFLQVHFASDVLAGFASGSAWLAMCIVGIESARRYRRRA
jgi:undecaprenyl-diphosphatase